MSEGQEQVTDGSGEAEIRALMEARAQAIRERDAEPLVSALDSRTVLFDALTSLDRRGEAEGRLKIEEWLGWYEGELGFEMRDVTVAASGDVGYCHYLYHVFGTMKNDTKVDMWLRATACLRKVDGSWKVVHEHTSVPFDPESGQALVTLKP